MIRYLLTCISIISIIHAAEGGFAKYLIEQNEPQLAVYAYRQALFTASPQEQPKLKLQLADLYAQLHNEDQAITLYNEVIDQDQALEKSARTKLAQLYFHTQEYSRAEYEYTEIGTLYNDHRSYYLAGWAALNDQRSAQAKKLWTISATTKNAQQQQAQELLAQADRFELLPQKNSNGAQIASALLPGAGQLYAENWQDGLVSFLLNSITLSLCANALQNNRTGEALVWGTLETAWYFGGIYSAGNSAQKYNRNVKTRFLEDLEEQYNFKNI